MKRLEFSINPVRAIGLSFLSLVIAGWAYLHFDNRICYSEMRYVSDIDYLHYAINPHLNFSDGEITRIKLHPVTKMGYLSGRHSYEEGYRVFYPPNSEIHVYFRGNDNSFLYNGKELFVKTKDEGYIVSRSPCGQSIFSTR